MKNEIIRTSMGAYVLKNDTHMSRYVETSLTLDWDNARIVQFADYIKPGYRVLDAGACIGDHTLSYAKLVGDKGFVYALEPNPLSFECLKKNMSILNNVVCHNYALSDVLTKVSITSDPNIGASYLKRFEGTNRDNENQVNTITIDSYVEGYIDRLDFIHLDVEGFEYFVIKGAMKTIKKFNPVFVIEVCPSHMSRYGVTMADLNALIDSIGYELKTITGQTHISQRDMLVVPKNK